MIKVEWCQPQPDPPTTLARDKNDQHPIILQTETLTSPQSACGLLSSFIESVKGN